MQQEQRQGAAGTPNAGVSFELGKGVSVRWWACSQSATDVTEMAVRIWMYSGHICLAHALSSCEGSTGLKGVQYNLWMGDAW